jgi:hypothetical protein
VNTLEERLAAAMEADAQAAPAAGDLLARVQTHARRRARRRVLLATSGAVAAVTVAASAVAALPGDTGELRPPQQYASAAPDGPLEAAAQLRLTFPLTPGWLPDGVATTPVLSLGQSGLEASYRAARKGRDGELEGIQIWSSDHDVTLTGDGVTRHATTVDGHPGIVATTHGEVSLGWQPVAGKWQVVTAFNDWASEETARRVAGSLTPDELFGRPPFRFDLQPRDSEVAAWSTDGRVVFVPAGQGKVWRERGSVDGAVQIGVRRATADLTGRGESVEVQGRPGWLLTETDGRKTLIVQLTDAIVLVVDAPAWSRDDVIRLGDATHYLGGLPPAEG